LARQQRITVHRQHHGARRAAQRPTHSLVQNGKRCPCCAHPRLPPARAAGQAPAHVRTTTLPRSAGAILGHWGVWGDGCAAARLNNQPALRSSAQAARSARSAFASAGLRVRCWRRDTLQRQPDDAGRRSAGAHRAAGTAGCRLREVLAR
jgi:hypothetical protein